MKIAALRDDNWISVDGALRMVTWSDVLPAGWHAIHWEGTHGEIEFLNPPRNVAIYEEDIPNLLKAIWDTGTLGYDPATLPAPSDAVAQARADILDALIVAAAAVPGAPKVLTDAAAIIGPTALTIDKGGLELSDSLVVVAPGG